MTKKKYEIWRSPLAIPEAKSGDFEIKHMEVPEAPLVSFRETITTGKKPKMLQFDPPLKIHQLTEGGGTWMTDLPQEVRQAREAIKNFFGHVLVGGLGLGLVPTLLLRKGCDVTVVEKSQDVINLTGTGFNEKRLKVYHDDILRFLRTNKDRYDGYYMDTWQGTNEGTWWSEVLPLRRLIGPGWGTRFYWAEDQMLGQVAQRLLNATQPHWYYIEELRLPMTKEEALFFVYMAGSPEWEKKYGRLFPKDGSVPKEK